MTDSLVDQAVALRADGGGDIGLGHIRRCLALAAEIDAAGSEPFFVLGASDGPIGSFVETAGYKVYRLPHGVDLAGEVAALSALGLPQARAIVLDISHYRTLAQRPAMRGYTAGLSEVFPIVGLIDGLMDSCIASFDDLAVDVVVVPYAGAETQYLATANAVHAKGPCYFVLDRSFAPYLERERVIRPTCDRILVTAGGSDPAGITASMLAAFDRIDDRRLDLRVVLGPIFSAQAIDEIEGLASRSKHCCTLLRAPTTLADQMLWCDLAIAASGLTKYELAATGTPALLISIDAVHAAYNAPFAALGTSRHLGVAAEVDAFDAVCKAMELLGDAAARERMSEAGRQLLDGHGARRIVGLLKGSSPRRMLL